MAKFFRNIFRKNVMTQEQKMRIDTPAAIESTPENDTTRAIYARKFVYEILPLLEQVSNQSRYGYHGLTHTEQVAMFGIDLAIAANTDVLPVLLACSLHDCARKHDKYDELHGPACEPIARKFLAEHYPNVPQPTVEKIVYAVKNHTTGRQAPDMISACLWDADRIRLGWEYGYRPQFMSTPRGHQLASLSPQDQKKYITDQEDFLVRHYIKTREKIEFEKACNMAQNATKFKVR